MAKRLFSFILSLLMVLSIVPLSVLAEETESTVTETTGTQSEETTATEEESSSEDILWEYEAYGDSIALTKYLGTQADVYVPNKLEVNGTEYKVIKLAEGIFENNDTVNSVTLASGILEIGDRAFYDCDSLVCILLSEELTTIGAEAFYSCDSFNSVILYDSITSIGENAFAECPKLTVWCNEGTTGFIYAVNNSVSYALLNPDATPETVEQDGINYYIMNGEAVAIGVTDTAITEAVIPQNINGSPVTELRETFKYCYPLTSVTLPSGLKTIGTKAFYCCSRLTSITIPDSVTSIGNFAFSYCTSLTSVAISDSVISIGNSAFSDCTSLTSIEMPNSVTSIGTATFQECTSLVNVMIPDSVTNIGTKVFQDCTSLISVTISNSITSISMLMFSYCTSLTNVTIPDSVTNIGSSAFIGCASLKTVIVPSSVTSISTDSFLTNTVLMVEENSYAHTFAVDNGLLYHINDGTNEAEVYDVDSVRYFIQNGEAIAIGVTDTAITEAVIPTTVEGYHVTELRETFNDCKSLTSVILPNTLKTISKNTFYDCNKLTSITIPDGVTSIGDSAFTNCTSLTSVEIPDSVASIGDSAFSTCISLTSITIPNGVTSIGTKVFNSCGSLTSITIPDSVTTIRDRAFNGCGSLTRISIPNSVTSIGSYVFQYCSTLTSIEIPNSVTSIGDYAFSKCRSLKTAVVPSSVIKMHTSSFPSTTVLMVEESSYTHTFAVDNGLLYYIYDGTNEPGVYDVDNIRYFIQNDEAIAIGVTDTAITEAVIPTTVEGYPVTELRETFYNCRSLTSVTLPNSLKTVGKLAFCYCYKLTSIIIPDSVISVGDRAFANSSLTSITIPNGVTNIGESAFVNCTSLASVSIPDSVTSIGFGVFWYCSSLTSITIPNSITSISDYAFACCTNLTSIEIPNSVTSIGDYAFENCKNLTSIIITNNITSIGNYAFSCCSSFTSVTIPDSVTSIGFGVFWYCSSLTSITIPNSVTSIGDSALGNCTSLKTVVIPSSVTTMSTSSFPASTVLMVEDNSYTHTFAVKNNLLYFVLHKMENPEISYGVGIEGVVTNSDGTVASGVTVEIYHEDGTLKESVVTDENGAYAFTYAEVGKYTIKTYNEAGNSASTSVSVKRMNVFDVFLMGDTSITLKNSFNVSGTVSDSSAAVKITDLDGNVIAALDTTNGAFEFAEIANGTYLVTAESENGFASKEITVYNNDVTDISLVITADVASIWGYVEVEDRQLNKHRRHWVTVSVYNEEGNVIATQKSDKDGKYYFANLPLGDYSVVATVSEMRPDKKHGYDRSHELYGYAYVSLTESGTFEVDTIVLYEDNGHTANVSGKVNINKDKSNTCEIVMYNAFGIEYAKVDSENGRYSFKNVKDGLYIITAITENDGMGYTVITVRNGKVYGNTNINIVKSDKIKDREDKFGKDIPDLENDSEIEGYRARIADEKRFYDSLSQKEKKQLSKEYVRRLNQYIEWLSKCDYTSSDSTRVENGGLVVSGDELENGDEISFTITVEKQEMWKENTNGVETAQDFIHHSINDKAGNSEIVQYYEISMTKTSNGSDKAITSVYKDTDAMGKFRITLEIPEEYRGYKHYSLVHVHCGEVVTLTDLDNDPNTITIEVDKFSTFALATTNEELVDEAESTVTIDAIITFKGYSVGPDGTSMCAGFDIDRESLELYEQKTGKTIDFGVVFTSYELLGGKSPLVSETGEIITDATVIKSSLKDYAYSTYELVLTDITEEYANHKFVVSAYLYDGEAVSYIQGNEVSKNVMGHSLNEVKETVQ